MDYSPFSSAIIARKRVTAHRMRGTQKVKKREGCPKRANQLKKPTLIVGLVERQNTLRIDVDRVQVPISLLNVIARRLI